MTPEHLHLAVNHLPFLGSAFALLPLVVGILRKNKACLLSGLAIAALAGGSTMLVMESGEEAYERYEDGPPAAFLDTEAEAYLHIHEERAEFWGKVLAASAILSTIAFLATLGGWPYSRELAIASTVVCLIAFLAGIWIAESGGKIRRPDFRSTDSRSAIQSQDHDHDDDDD